MRRPILGALVSIALLTGCGDGGTAPTPEKEPTAEVEQAQPVDGTANALKVRGARFAADVPDMSAVVSEAEPQLPATVTDATDAEVVVTAAERILTFDLYGTLTDTIIGLGLGERLVGRSVSDTQTVLADLPVVTYGSHDLNVEAVLDLDPDLILTNGTIGTEEVYEQLRSAGVTVVTFDHVPSLEAIGDTISLVGQAVGLPEAARELAEYTDRALDEALEEVNRLGSATPNPPRGIVLYVRGTAGVFFILGQEYGASDILTALGLEDSAAESGITNLKPANAEALVSLDPEIVLAMKHGVESTGGVDGLLERPGLAATTAGANERLVIAGDNQLLAYGPRTPDNLIALAEAIYLAETE